MNMLKFMVIMIFVVSGSVHASLNRALYLKDQGKLKEAEELLMNIVTNEPENAQALQALGIVKYRQGDFKNAKTYFSDAARFADNVTLKEQALYNKGSAEAQLKEYEEAQKSFADVLEINPKNEQAQQSEQQAEKLLKEQKMKELLEKAQQKNHHQQKKKRGAQNQQHENQLSGAQEQQQQEGQGGTSGASAQQHSEHEQSENGIQELQKIFQQDNQGPYNASSQEGTSSPENNQGDEQLLVQREEEQDGEETYYYQEQPSGDESEEPEDKHAGYGQQQQQGAASSQYQAAHEDHQGQGTPEDHADDEEKKRHHKKHGIPLVRTQDGSDDNTNTAEEKIKIIRCALEDDERLSSRQKKILAAVENEQEGVQKQMIIKKIHCLPRDHGQKNW